MRRTRSIQPLLRAVLADLETATRRNTESRLLRSITLAQRIRRAQTELRDALELAEALEADMGEAL